MEFGWSADQQSSFDETVAAVGSAFPPEDRPRNGFSGRKDWLRLGELGLLGLSVPRELAGSGLGALDTARRIEAFGRGCSHTGLVFGACAHLLACAMPIAEFGTGYAKGRYLPGMCRGELIAGNAMTESEAGSDVARLSVTATEVPGGWLLNGEKTFVTNGPVADVFVTYATSDPAAGHLGVTGFVVDRNTPGLTVGEPFEKMGLDEVPAGSVRFAACFVADEQVLGQPGGGGAVFQQSMGWERACLFAGFLGLHDRLIERCVDHVRTRHQSGRRISGFQAVSHRVAQMKVRAESARLLLYRACWELDQGSPATLAVALSKLAVSEGLVAGALDAVRLFGGRGYLREDGIEAVLRDAVPTLIFSGTSDIQLNLIARELGL